MASNLAEVGVTRDHNVVGREVQAMSSLEGATALVTGGARGIGAAAAQRLAADGARVVVADFDEAAARETAEQIGGTAVRCDVTSRADIDAALALATEGGARLEILVTCAGIIRDNLLFKMTDEDWDAVIDTHLKGTFYAVRAAQARMVEQRSGKIVLISSTSALGNRGQTNYSAAKAGLQGMTKTLALELGPFGINVNCVAPGFIATAMTQQTAARMRMSFEEFKEAAAADVPLRRVGEPEDVASVIAFLCSKDASYVSGQVIYVRGGP
jgi:3-oxoacyl-[acyl-carrier protein] reductase